MLVNMAMAGPFAAKKVVEFFFGAPLQCKRHVFFTSLQFEGGKQHFIFKNGCYKKVIKFFFGAPLQCKMHVFFNFPPI